MNMGITKYYEKIEFRESLLPLFCELLNIKKKTQVKGEQVKYIKVFDVLVLIGKNSKSGKKGITKKMIQQELRISRKVCDDIICLLEGATLISYIDTAREQPYKCTIRGKQLGRFYKERFK